MKAWDYLSSGFSSLALPTNIQKRLYKFLLRKALGQFLATDLDLDNFDIELVNGSVELRDLDLNLETLNNLLGDTALTVVQGHIGSITALLPWSNFWSGEIALKLHGLTLTVEPNLAPRRGSTEDLEASILSSSLHFADDFLKSETDQELVDSIAQLQESVEEPVDGPEGLQVLTRVIDKMLAKIKVDVTKTEIRARLSSSSCAPSQPPDSSKHELVLELPRIAYFDETPAFADPQTGTGAAPTAGSAATAAGATTTTHLPAMTESSILLPAPPGAEIVKIITIATPKLFLRGCQDKFPEKRRKSEPLSPGQATTTSESDTTSFYSLASQSETALGDSDDDDDDNGDEAAMQETAFYDMEQSYLFGQASIMSTGSITPRALSLAQLDKPPYDALLLTTVDKEDSWIRIRTVHPNDPHGPPFSQNSPNSPNSQTMMSNAPGQTNIDVYISGLRFILTPKQLDFLLELANAAPTPPTPPVPQQPQQQSPVRRPSSSSSASSSTSSTSTPQYTSPRGSMARPSSQPPQKRVISPSRAYSTSFSRHPSMPSSSSAFPRLKIKCQIPRLDFYFFYADDGASPTTWLDNGMEEGGGGANSHLRLTMDQWITRWQRHAKDILRVDGSSSSSSPPATTMLASILDLKIQDMALDEWVAPSDAMSTPTKATAIKMEYGQYIPVLECNHSAPHSYNDRATFPSYAANASVFAYDAAKSKKDAIRLRIETRTPLLKRLQKHPMSTEQDINVDIQPLKLTIDPKIADRLENYVYTLLQAQQRQKAKAPTPSPPAEEPSVGQRIFEDLEHAATEQHHRLKARVRLAFVRLVLLTPDMSLSNTRDDFNDTFHGDLLSVDVKKITAHWDTDLALPQPQKVILDLDWIKVFMKQANDTMHRCWFTAMTHTKESVTSTTTCPSVEIKFWLTAPPAQGHTTTSSARSCYFGSGSDIPSNLFEHLSRNESVYSDQKVHVPMEDQADSAMVFKQRMVETSTFVINCHLPITHMSLSKPCWDKVQILQNDVLLWQPRFVTRLAAAQSSLSSSSSGSSPPPHFHPRRTSHDSLGSDLFATASDRFSTPLLSSSSFMSQSHERIGALYDHAAAPPPPPTLLAVVVVMAEGIWDLHTMTAEKRATYRLQFTDFRYFNAIKHMGNDENVTTLDIEDLTLDDFSDAQRPERLVARTLAKPLMPKKNTAMVSLFSRLIMSPALSKQTKLTSIVVCNACWKFSADISFIDQLVSFQSMPQDMVFIDPPTQYITVYAHILDTSVDYKPRHSPSRATVVVDNLQIATDIVVGQPLVDVRTYIQNVDVFLVDDVMDLDELSVVQAGSGRPLEARQYWTLIGMKSVVMSRNLEAQVKIKLNEMLAAPNVDIAVLNDILTVEGCSDSFQSLVNLVTYVANDGDDLFPHTAVPYAAKAARTAKRHSHTTLQKHREDMLASLDEHAFNQRQASTSVSASSSTGKTKSQLSTLANGPLSTASPELNLIEGFYSSSSSSSTPSQEKRKQNQPLPVTGTQTSTSSSLRPRKPLRKQPHPRLHRPATAAEDIVRVLASDVHELDIVENFFGMDKKKEARKPVVDTRRAKLSVRVRDVDILWKMYAGHDWHYVQQQQQQHSPPISLSSPQGASPPMSTSSRASSRHTTHPTTHPTTASPSYGSPSTISSLDSRRAHTIGPPRGEPEMELRVEGITLALDIMPANDQTALHTHLTIRDIELADNLKTSNWDVFFGYMRADEPTSNMPRERDADMLVLDVLGVRPVKHDDTIEYRVKLKTLPLRFYIDQDALNFLVQFFAFNPAVLHSTPAEAIQAPDDDHVENDLFFQQVEIYPIRLKIDYKPKYVNYDNIKEGQFAELVNLFRLEGAKLDLSAVKLTGIRGVGKLVERLGQEWLPHIKQTQVPHMVSGVTPIRSMVNLGSGIADLVLIPLQQYRRDGRVIKGLQKGTQSFARSTAMEIIKLSALLASGTNVIWEHALNSTSASSSSSSAQGNNNFIRNSQDTRRNHNDLQQPSASGMPSSSLSPTSTVIASRTSDDMVFVFTDRHLDLDP